VGLRVPNTEGVHTWEATTPASGPGLPHTDLGVRVISTSECLVAIVARDAEHQRPVQGLRVVTHPYRALTDEHAVARVRVADVNCRSFVSGKNYIPFRCDHELTDVTIQAELGLDVGLSEADLWSS